MANLISQVTPLGQSSDYGFRASAVQYGTCPTGAGTGTKAVTCASFTSDYLTEGSIVAVKFSTTNSAAVANLKLNVNSTGEKPIKYIYNGTLSNLPAVDYLKANQIYLFYYDGTNWVMLLNYDTNDVSSLTVTSANNTAAFGSTVTVGTVNGTDLKFTMPANPNTNTDTLVTQTVTTTDATYEVLFSESADNTTHTETARKNNNLTFNPSTGNLTVTKINNVALGSSPKFTDTIISVAPVNDNNTLS